MSKVDIATSESRQIARFMGLPKWKDVDDIDLVEWVKRGFPAGTATIVTRRVDPHERFVRAVDIIPKSSLHRRKDKNLTKDQSESIWALSRVFCEVLRIYSDDLDRAALFLVNKHPLLGDRSPLSLAKESAAGADLVLRHLAKAEAGVAV